MPRIWNNKWVENRPLRSGGQGSCFLVHHVDGKPEGSFVLKALKDHHQKDPERRARMYREVAALQTLSHPGIQKLIDSNADRFQTEEKLYLVSEYVVGPTLHDAVKDAPWDLDRTLSLADRLLDILQYSHERGVLHRDIKPDNILLKDGDPSEAVLIDFGLSFNSDVASTTPLTHSLQQLGNRFLHLPELQHESSLKRDPLSDLTQFIGIIYFTLTGVAPVALLDENGAKPHKRISSQVFSTLSGNERTELFALFDIGFELLILQRWQSIEAIRKQLLALRASDATKTVKNPQEALQRVVRSIQDVPEFRSRQRIGEVLTKVSESVGKAHEELRVELTKQVPGIAMSQTGFHLSVAEMVFKNQLAMFHQASPERRFEAKYTATVVGNEVVLNAMSGETETELYRTPMTVESDFIKLRARVKEYMLEGMENIYNG